MKPAYSKRAYYAFSHAYGGLTVNSNSGERIGDYYVFDSKQSRDQWVGESTAEYVTDKGYREAIGSNDTELRRLLGKAERKVVRNMMPVTKHNVWYEAGIQDYYTFGP